MNVNMGGATAPSGALSMNVTRDLGMLRSATGWKAKNWLTKRWKEDAQYAARVLLGGIVGGIRIESRLFLKVLHADGTVTDLGLAGRKVVTTAGVGFIVDAFQNLVELENMKFHGFGTGGSAEAVGNTALATEVTTEYATDNVRPTGTTTEGASANIYRTVATFSPNAGGTIAVTEHGIFDQAANSGGVLLDRTLFSAVNLVASSDSLQVTYELTFTAGS